MPRKIPILLLALGLIAGALAMFFTRLYINQQRQLVQIEAKDELARQQQLQSTVLVATKDIPKGATIESDMLKSKVVPKEYIQPYAVNYPERILGMLTVAPIANGEQITLSKLVSAKQATTGSGSSLAMATPVGKRAISIPADNVSSLMWMIRPGDYVDVISLVPVPVQTAEGKQVMQQAVMPLFQNVLVLAVGRDLAAAQAPPEKRYVKEEAPVSPLITLALSAQEASLIAFVQEQGKIRLILRSPADSRIEPVQPASWDTLFQYLMPQIYQKEPGADQETAQMIPKDKQREIEIYRGLKKETIPLSR